MNCDICGGILNFEKGFYVCSNCDNKQQISAFFENTDVFICYLENDEQGRRTRDSIIANDLYNKLQAVNINAFYQRISASELTGYYYQKACAEAFNKAKIILVTGTSKDIFERLTEEKEDELSGKMIIPVYSNMNASDLPELLVNLQAVNYDNIGVSSDLTKNILQILGRESEIDTLALALEKESKRKFKIFAGITFTALFIIGIAVYFIFGTPYVLKSKKYNYASILVQKNHYAEAINYLSKLGNYRNSENMLKSIYDKYDGYFNDEQSKISLYLQTDNTDTVHIEFKKNIDGAVISVNTTAELYGAECDFKYTDSLGSRGKGSVRFLDDGIDVNIKTEKSTSKSSIGNTNTIFYLKNKTDHPLETEITKETIEKWLATKTTKSDILKSGYELETESDFIYKIKNTDIKLEIIPYDFIEYGNLIMEYNDAINSGYKRDYPPLSDLRVEDGILYAVTAPANVVMANKIGQQLPLYIDDTVAYAPFVRVGQSEDANIWIYAYDTSSKQIEASTEVSVVSKTVLGEYWWFVKLSDFVGYGLLDNGVISVVGENNTEIVVFSSEIHSAKKRSDTYWTYRLYNINKKTFEKKLVKEQVVTNGNTESATREFLHGYYIWW